MNEVLKSIKRTPYQSMASFLILFFTLFMTLFFFNLISFFYGMLSYVEAKPQVTVYFQAQTAEDSIFNIRDKIAASGKASEIKYVSKKEALKIYKDLHKNNPLLIEMVSSDILPASLEIYAKKPQYLFDIAESLKKEKGVDEVQFQKNIVDQLLMLTNILRKVSMFIFGFLLLISFVVLMTTTAFKIALKKKEIELMKLLGASNFYVRKPFLLEGIFFGFISATIAFIFFHLIVFYLQPFLTSYLAGIPRLAFYNLDSMGLYVWPPSLNFVLLSYVIIVIAGMFIGFIGNMFATSKFIK